MSKKASWPALKKPETSDLSRLFVSGFLSESEATSSDLLFNNVDKRSRAFKRTQVTRILTLVFFGVSRMRCWAVVLDGVERSVLFWVIWSSYEAYTVDALAARGDEGRCSLR